MIEAFDHHPSVYRSKDNMLLSVNAIEDNTACSDPSRLSSKQPLSPSGNQTPEDDNTASSDRLSRPQFFLPENQLSEESNTTCSEPSRLSAARQRLSPLNNNDALEPKATDFSAGESEMTTTQFVTSLLESRDCSTPTSASSPSDGVGLSSATTSPTKPSKSGSKISSVFIDLSLSPSLQRLTLGRDRARSESGPGLQAFISSSSSSSSSSNQSELPPKKMLTRRGESIRKSLIKLGSFGKDQPSGKTKSKKEKERDRQRTDSGDLPPLRRTGSDRSPGHAIWSLQSPKLPDSRNSGRFVTSPLPSCQTDISLPQALEDPEKLKQMSEQTLTMMQMMYDTARRECEELKQEYQRVPTEVVHANLEAKVKVLRRLESQLSTYGGEVEGSPGDKRSLRRGSSIESNPPAADGDASSRPPPPPSHYVSRHKGSDAGVAQAESRKSDVSLSRSHSDSYKRIKKASGGDCLRFTSSSDEIRRLAAIGSGSGEFKAGSQNEMSVQSKSQDATSDDSSDPALNRFSQAFDRPPLTPGLTIHDASNGSRPQSNIIAMDDYEFGTDDERSDEFEDDGSPFSDFSVLKDRPAHLAVFLHYLISNSDASPLLFYLISGPSYSNGGSTKELRKWSYEIFSTFLADKAPWKVKVDEQYLETINNTLMNKYDNEGAMRNVFATVREFAVLPQIKELLADYRSKRALGLGALYGEFELKEGLDHAGVNRVVDSVLWKHFEHSADDDCERSQAFASALATIFKIFGCVRNSSLLERVQTFNAKEKDRTRISVFSKGPKKEKSFTHRGHNLMPQQYFVLTNCSFCQSVLFGVGNQGYQCQKCEQNFHKSCLEKIKELCSGKKPKLSKVSFSITKKPIHTSIEEPSEDELAHKDSSSKATERTDPPKLVEEAKPAASLDLTIHDAPPHNEELHNLVPRSVEPSDVTRSPPPSYTSSLVFNVSGYSTLPPDNQPPSYSSVSVVGNPDLEVEQDLPPLEAVIPKEYIKKLEKKEKKRQEVINELFYTEKTHLRDMKVLKLIFCMPMSADPTFADLSNLVFPGISEIVDFHSDLSNEFKRLRSTSEHGIVGDFAETLVKYFSGETGESFKRACGRFCENQPQAQEQLRSRPRKDPKLAAFLQLAESNPACRRLALKDFLPIPMQRLTKYPLLIENLIKNTSAESPECSRLRAALDCSRDILSSVNKTISDFQNRLKLLELQKKLDLRPMENSSLPNLDLTNYTLLFDGPLTWRRRDRMIPLHVVLLDSVLLLLQKQDDRLVLRCENTAAPAVGPASAAGNKKTTHSPIIQLSKMITRPVATDKCALFLISMSGIGAQIYELVAASKDEKNKWLKHINSALGEANQHEHTLQFPNRRASDTRLTDPGSANESVKRKHESLDVICDEDEDVAQNDEIVRAKENQNLSFDPPENQNDDYNLDEQTTDALAHADSDDVSATGDPIEQLKWIDNYIQTLTEKKMKIWLQLWHELNIRIKTESSEEYAVRANYQHVLTALREDVDRLMCLIKENCSLVSDKITPIPSQTHSSDTVPDGSRISHFVEQHHSGLPTHFQFAQIIELNQSIHNHLLHLLESVIKSEDEKVKLLMDLNSAQEQLSVLELSSEDRSPEHSAEHGLSSTLLPTADLHEKERLQTSEFEEGDSEEILDTGKSDSADLLPDGAADEHGETDHDRFTGTTISVLLAPEDAHSRSSDA